MNIITYLILNIVLAIFLRQVTDLTSSFGSHGQSLSADEIPEAFDVRADMLHDDLIKAQGVQL